MKTFLKVSLLAFAILTCDLAIVRAQPFVSVTSTNDGNGLFSYTFTLPSSTYAWGFTSNSSAMQMRFHGLETVFSPAGWASEIDTNNLVTWRYQNTDVVLFGSPSITFAIQSSSTTSALYNGLGASDPDYPRGVVFGTLYEQSPLNPFVVGYETFAYVGPAIVPEPSSAALLTGVLIGLGFRRFFRKPQIDQRSDQLAYSPIAPAGK